MTGRSKYPEPPISRMRPGQVWEVSLLERRRRFKTPFGEARQRFIKFLLMIIDPFDHGWRLPKNRWWHSLPKIGNLQNRTEGEVWDDLRKLRNQDPPYERNYKPLTRMYRGDYFYWERPIEWRNK